MFYYGYNTKLGKIYISADEKNILEISFNKPNYRTQETPLIKRAFSELEEYFNGQRKTFDLPLKLEGTEFQKKVWLQLMNIPYGKTTTYKDIATEIGNTNASRAVGNANNKNPIAIIIPCHRVIGSNNKLTGYAGGLDKKEKLLNLEKNNK